MVSMPLKSGSGVYVYVPSGFITTLPFVAPPSTPTSDHVFPPSPLGVSFVEASPITGVSSFVVFVSSTATGTSLTGVIVMIISAVEQSPLVSHTIYVIVSMPLKSGSGVYVYVPSGFITTLPFVAPPSTPTRVQVLPPSPLAVSFVEASPDTGVSSIVVFVSSTATGTSLTGVIVMIISAVEQSPLVSHTIYVIVSMPLKSGSGVYVYVPSGFITTPPFVAPPSTPTRVQVLPP